MQKKIFTRDFIRGFLGLFSLASVYHILIPTLPVYLSRLGATEVEIGILIGIFCFSSVVFRPIVGRALLKIPEKRMIIAGSFLYTFTSVAYLVAPPFWPFLIVRVLQGIGFACYHTASITWITTISPEDRRGQSLSYFILAFNIPGALAPSIGMLLINQFNFAVLFLVCLGLSLCSLVVTRQLGSGHAGRSQDSFPEEGRYLSRKALAPSMVGFFSLFIWGGLTAFFPLYAISHGVTNPGLFFTTTAIMLVLGRALCGKLLDMSRRERLVLPCLTTYVISMALLAFSTTLPMFILVAVILGIGHAFLVPAMVLYALDRTGSATGPAMGTFNAVLDLGMSLGPVMMGLVLRSTSYPIMFLCLAFVGLINFNYFYFFTREKR